MNKNLSSPAIRPNKALGVLIASLAVICSYKMYQYTLRQVFALDPFQDYYAYQTYCTYFRIASTVIGLFLVSRLYIALSEQLKPKLDKNLVFLILHFLSFIILKKVFFSIEGRPSNEVFSEIFFNLFTGISEEILFRGIILISLVSQMSHNKAIFLSSVLFAAFHMGSGYEWIDYISIFFFGIFYSLLFLTGTRLVWLCIFHFAIDMVHFSFVYTGDQESGFLFSQLAITLILIFRLGARTDNITSLSKKGQLP